MCFSPEEVLFHFSHIFRETQINPGEKKQTKQIKTISKLSRYGMMKGSEWEAINQPTIEGFSPFLQQKAEII